LREENARLTETVRVLRETLNDLANQNFDQAMSRRADTEAPVTDPVEQYKALVTLRLREQIVNCAKRRQRPHQARKTHGDSLRRRTAQPEY